MSIIDDIRINQDLDKDGKYVCDLNPKEKTQPLLDIKIGSHVIDMDTKFTLDKQGIHVPLSGGIVIPSVVYVNIALQWLQNSKKYDWEMKDLQISYKDYISNLITELQYLI